MWNEPWVVETRRILAGLGPFVIGVIAIGVTWQLRKHVGVTGALRLGDIFDGLEAPTDPRAFVTEVRVRALRGVAALLFVVAGAMVVALSIISAVRTGGKTSRWFMIVGSLVLGLAAFWVVGPRSKVRTAGDWLDVLHTRGDIEMSRVTAWLNGWTAFVIIAVVMGFTWLTVRERSGAPTAFDQADARRAALQRFLGASTLVLIAAVAEVYTLFAWPATYTEVDDVNTAIMDLAVSMSFAAGASYSVLLGALYWTTAAFIQTRFGLSEPQQAMQQAVAASRIPLPIRSLLSAERLQAFFGAMAPLIAAILLALLEQMKVSSAPSP